MTFSLLRRVVHRLRAVRLLFEHRGDRYTCPFCGYRARDLRPMGIDSPVLVRYEVIGGGRRNGACWKCGSVDRERLLFLYLRDEYRLFERDRSLRILHVAPEVPISDRIREAGFHRYLCGDLFTEGYSYPDYVQDLDLLDMDLPAESFDLILCNHVLEHIIPDLRAMKALHDVLRPGGTGVLQVPISRTLERTFEDPTVTTPEERLRVFGQDDHVRVYGQDYPDRLRSVGFEVERVSVAERYAEHGVLPDEDLFVVTRPA